MSDIPAEVRTALEGLRALGGDGLLTQMVSVFVEYSRDRMSALQQCVAAGDVAGASSAAHALKGSARQLGFTAMADACAATEAGAKSGDLAAVQKHAAVVYAEYTTAVGWLEELTA